MSKLFIITDAGLTYYSAAKKRFVSIPAGSAACEAVQRYLMEAESVDENTLMNIRRGTPDIKLPKALQSMFDQLDGTYYARGVEVPNSVVRAVAAVCGKRQQAQAADRLRKFFDNCAKNPSTESVCQLFCWVTNHNLTITDDGKFIAYKGVNQDYTDCHTGKIDNSPGAEVTMERSEVNADPLIGCSTGLHVANESYAKTYGSKLLTVLVDPADVVSVPQDCNFQKIRVCRYVVLEDITEGASADVTETTELDVVSAKDNSLKAPSRSFWNEKTNELLLDLCYKHKNAKGRVDWPHVAKLLARSEESVSRQYRRLIKGK